MSWEPILTIPFHTMMKKEPSILFFLEVGRNDNCVGTGTVDTILLELTWQSTPRDRHPDLFQEFKVSFLENHRDFFLYFGIENPII